MIRIETDKELIKVAEIEEIIDRASVIIYNDETVEVEGYLVIQKEIGNAGKIFDIARAADSIFQRFMHIYATIVKAPEEDFNKIVDTLNTVEVTENVLALDLPLKPERRAIVNLRKIKENLVVVSLLKEGRSVLSKEPGRSLLVNDILFTTDPIEFHGSGMFTTKKSFLVDDKTFDYLEGYFIEES